MPKLLAPSLLFLLAAPLLAVPLEITNVRAEQRDGTKPVAVLDGTGGTVSVPVDHTAPAQFFRVTVDLAEPMGEGASGSR